MNVLITADIHLGEYNDYNYTPNARVNQFYALSKRYIEMAIENNCTELWIAGDFLKVPNNIAKVQHTLKEFLKPLSEHFTKIRYILGNHDINNKSDSIDIKDTIVTLFDFDNFEYCNKKIIKFKDTEIAFMNWYPNQDLSWIDGKVDILIGHYTKSTLFGQDIDETKFDLCIHGDIHNDQVIGKFVSINTPFQHDMSSVSEGSCIILNPETKEWKRVRTDPDHTRFLKISYVTEQLLEGFESPLKYNIYRPVIAKNTEGLSIDVPKWKDISDLIESLVIANNLSITHDEIKSKCIDYSEIDFNFQLKYAKIEGYRSLVEFDMQFDGNDRIILLGKNGSGKSSIIRALKAIFEKSRYMKDERSEFTDSVTVECGLFYQNKLFEITKGDSWGLKIDGVPQTYNNQTQFENDLFEKLPFFEYADLFFITSDIHNLSSQFTPDRRIELISKFYRLDRIDAYSRTAYSLDQDLIQTAIPIKDDLIKAKGALESIQLRLQELDEVKTYDIDHLKSLKLEYSKLREDYEYRQVWERERDKLQTRITELTRVLSTYEIKLNPDLGIEYINNRLTEITSQIVKVKEIEGDLRKRWQKLLEISPIRDRIFSRKSDIDEQIESLKIGECLHCGSKLTEGRASSKIEELNVQIDNLREEYKLIGDDYDSFTEEELTPLYFENRLKELKSGLESKSDEYNILNTKKTQYDIAKENYDLENENLTKVKLQLEEYLTTEPKEVKLPMNLSTLEEDVISKLANYDNYEKEKIKESDKLEEIILLEDKIKELQDKSDRYNQYMQLMSRTGKIYEEILRKLAEVFSESEFKYEVNAGEYRGRKFITFNSFYKVKSSYRIYERLSDGQKTVCDLDFLNKLFSVRVGILVLDEHLRHLDEDNLPKASDILSKMNTNSVVISTHDTNYSQYTKKVLLELDIEGKTKYNIY